VSTTGLINNAAVLYRNEKIEYQEEFENNNIIKAIK
jgi:hypothetical protein